MQRACAWIGWESLVTEVLRWLGLHRSGVTLGLLFWLSGSVLAAPSGEGPFWRVGEDDCLARVILHRRHVDPGSKIVCERVAMETGLGTFASVVFPTQPLALIDELNLRVPVFSTQRGQQVMVRVVLPRSVNRKTGQPLTALIRGDVYDRPGVWQDLRVGRLTEELENQVRILRSQHGPEVDGREAYVDQLVVNLYTQPGITTARLGDPKIQGAVLHGQGQVRMAPEVGLVNAEAPLRLEDLRADVPVGYRPISFRMEGSLLLVDDRPCFVRAIQACGEDWAYLKQLGFNALRLSVAPTADQIQRAQELDLWLIAPPPLRFRDVDLAHLYRRVLAWDLGTHLREEDLADFKRRAQEIRAKDDVTARPILCGCDQGFAAFDRMADILMHHREPIGGNCSLDHYRQWLDSRPPQALPGTTHWAMIQTEPHPLITAQAMAFGVPPLEIDNGLTLPSQSIESLVRCAISAGMRGLVFASSNRLDADTPSARSRSLALQALNLKLDVLNPWIAGGQMAPRSVVTDSGHMGTLLRTARSWLVLPQEGLCASDADARGASAQDASGEGVYPTMGHVSIQHKRTGYGMQLGGSGCTISGVPDAVDVFQILPGGLRRISHHRSTGGICLADPSALKRALLLTREPMVVEHVHRRLRHQRTLAFKLQHRMVADQAVRTDRLLRQLNRSVERLQPVKQSVAACPELLQAKRYDEVQMHCDQSLQTLRSIYDQVERERPLADGLLPWHMHLQAMPWQDDLGDWTTGDTEHLIEGDLEDLAAMRQAGWRNWERSPDWLRSNVALTADQPRQGRSCLRMTTQVDAAGNSISDASGHQTGRRWMDQPPVWVSTPPMHFAPGTRIVIRGWARMLTEPTHSLEGALVYDSLAGPELGTRVQASTRWQPFSMLRVVDTSGEVTLTLALTGIGQVDWDGLSVREIR